MWEFLEEIVNLDSPSFEKELTDRVGARCAEQATAFGFDVEFDRQSEFGDNVVARLNPSSGEQRGGIVLVGHMDTVYGADTTEDWPFRRDDDKAYGPGIFDMKAGLVIGLWAARAAVDAAGDAWRTPLTFIFNSDEEPGSPKSRDVILREAPKHEAAFILEPGTGTTQPAITLRRKGVGIFRVQTKGASAHAGVEPENGVNSIVDMAHRILDMSAVADPAAGTTVTTGVVHGGTHPYVVPEECRLEIDVRVPTLEEQARVEQAFAEITARRYVDGASTVLEGGFHRPPMVPDERAETIAAAIVAISKDIGYPLVTGGSGGASDGNLTSSGGVPTVCGMGAHGGYAHSPREFIFAESLEAKCRTLARFLARWNSGDITLGDR